MQETETLLSIIQQRGARDSYFAPRVITGFTPGSSMITLE
jgi:hypothetical protein